jgi:site-specific DNA-methyltransferase (adenine-specific)
MSGNLSGFVGEVFCLDALRLLRSLPSGSIDSCITDPMYGVRKSPFKYDTVTDTFGGDPQKWWAYHQPIYNEIRRVLKPGGTFAWAMGYKFESWFSTWFGDYFTWALCRYQNRGLNVFAHFWVVQTREQEPIRFPARHGHIRCDTPAAIRRLHPCPKAVEEMELLVDALVPRGGVVLDCFAGIGATLLAAEKRGRRWIGCDISPRYCKVVLWRMAALREGLPGDDSTGTMKAIGPCATTSRMPPRPGDLGPEED